MYEIVQEFSRKQCCDEMRKFFEVSNQEEVKLGDLMRFEVVKNVIKPAFDKETLPDAHVREVAEELTLRPGEVVVQKSLRRCDFHHG